MSTDDTIGSEDCAKLLHCTPEQVEELARAGEIPGLKLGRGWLFVRADLLAYLAEKAREEAQQRRARRQPVAPIHQAAPIKSRRRQPPLLPVLARA
jgi:excisionase family DNA binding protein